MFPGLGYTYGMGPVESEPEISATCLVGMTNGVCMGGEVIRKTSRSLRGREEAFLSCKSLSPHTSLDGNDAKRKGAPVSHILTVIGGRDQSQASFYNLLAPGLFPSVPRRSAERVITSSSFPL